MEVEWNGTGMDEIFFPFTTSDDEAKERFRNEVQSAMPVSPLNNSRQETMGMRPVGIGITMVHSGFDLVLLSGSSLTSPPSSSSHPLDSIPLASRLCSWFLWPRNSISMCDTD